MHKKSPFETPSSSSKTKAILTLKRHHTHRTGKMAAASGRGSETTKSDDDDEEEHHAIFLIDGSEQSTSEEGDERFNDLRKVNYCDCRAKRRVEVLIDVA